MADSTPTPTPTPSGHTPSVAESSSFHRTVCLYDWWLIKAENEFQGKRLAVSGISSRKEEAVRVFTSTPVIKRFDVFSLETADGIYVMLKGFINEQRTLQNGFPSEVLDAFVFGFPPNWESFIVNFFREESTTGIDLGSDVPSNVSAIGPEILSDGVEKCHPTSLISPEEAPGGYKKILPEDECNASKEMGGVNAASGIDRSRNSAQFHNIKTRQQKKSASGGPLKHPDKEQSSTSGALENFDAEGLKTPVKPVRSWSRRQVTTSSEQAVRKSASRISRTLSANTEGCKKKKVRVCGVAVETNMNSPKRKMTKSASAVKYPRERDASSMVKGGKEKISSVSAESLSFRKSRSGRLLLPRLEFWRNQIPIYNADHEITEIQEGASLVSLCRGSSPSSSRKWSSNSGKVKAVEN